MHAVAADLAYRIVEAMRRGLARSNVGDCVQKSLDIWRHASLRDSVKYFQCTVMEQTGDHWGRTEKV